METDDKVKKLPYPETLIWAREFAGYDVDTVEEYGFDQIRDWESGKTTPSYSELQWLSVFYEVSMARLYCGIPDDD